MPFRNLSTSPGEVFQYTYAPYKATAESIEKIGQAIGGAVQSIRDEKDRKAKLQGAVDLMKAYDGKNLEAIFQNVTPDNVDFAQDLYKIGLTKRAQDFELAEAQIKKGEKDKLRQIMDDMTTQMGAKGVRAMFPDLDEPGLSVMKITPVLRPDGSQDVNPDGTPMFEQTEEVVRPPKTIPNPLKPVLDALEQREAEAAKKGEKFVIPFELVDKLREQHEANVKAHNTQLTESGRMSRATLSSSTSLKKTQLTEAGANARTSANNISRSQLLDRRIEADKARLKAILDGQWSRMEREGEIRKELVEDANKFRREIQTAKDQKDQAKILDEEYDAVSKQIGYDMTQRPFAKADTPGEAYWRRLGAYSSEFAGAFAEAKHDKNAFYTMLIHDYLKRPDGKISLGAIPQEARDDIEAMTDVWKDISLDGFIEFVKQAALLDSEWLKSTK